MKRTTTDTSSLTSRRGLHAALAAVALAAITAVAGCGGEGTEQASSPSNEAQPAIAVRGQATATTMPAVATPPSKPSSGGQIVTLGDSLPPDVAVAVVDSLVNPGDVVEITAQGSDDVSQIGLSDGLGRMQLFSRDPASNVWHVLYRVPVRTTKDRVALSVTALNDLNRWRRVWVFINVRQQASSEGCGSDDDSLFEE
jgi:hypothetical protein